MATVFTASLDKNIQRVKQEVNDKVKKTTIDLFLQIVIKSPSPSNPGPYAKGLLTNQWYPKVGQGFSDDVSTVTSYYGTGSKNRILALQGGREFFGKDGRISLTNNLDYAYKAEMGGWPNTLPYRMVALSIQYVAARSK